MMTGAGCAGATITGVASPVCAPGTLAGPAASALSIFGASVVVTVDADGYGDDVAQPAATPVTSASKHASDTFVLISTSKSLGTLQMKCHLSYSGGGGRYRRAHRRVECALARRTARSSARDCGRAAGCARGRRCGRARASAGAGGVGAR